MPYDMMYVRCERNPISYSDMLEEQKQEIQKIINEFYSYKELAANITNVIGKQIHFYESKKVYPKDTELIHDWASVNDAIKNGQEIIHTTQMCMLKGSFIYGDGYRLFVHQENGFIYEVKIKNKNKPDDQWTIRPAQNAYAMWAANVFRVGE